MTKKRRVVKGLKATGIVRNIDALGRITVPKEIRRVLKIEDDTPLELFIDDSGLYFRPFRLRCVLCGEETRNEIIGKRICEVCEDKLKDELKE